jgi:iron complex transport system substrate-binding protein
VLTKQLRKRIATVREAVAGRPRPRTFALEWSDPPFSAGHWVPDMIEVAGGKPILASTGAPSRRLRWEDVAEEAPEVVVFMPCGYGLDEAVTEGQGLLEVPALATAARIYAANANAYFSRPGPRVVDGVEALAWALHPEAVSALRPGAIRALRT